MKGFPMKTNKSVLTGLFTFLVIISALMLLQQRSETQPVCIPYGFPEAEFFVEPDGCEVYAFWLIGDFLALNPNDGTERALVHNAECALEELVPCDTIESPEVPVIEVPPEEEETPDAEAPVEDP